MIVLRKIPGMWRLAVFAGVMISAGSALAQLPQQVAPQKVPSQSMDRARYIPPGYVPDMNMYWRPEGRHPSVLRPLPPGVVSSPAGDYFEPMPIKYRGYCKYYRVKGYGW